MAVTQTRFFIGGWKHEPAAINLLSFGSRCEGEEPKPTKDTMRDEPLAKVARRKRAFLCQCRFAEGDDLAAAVLGQLYRWFPSVLQVLWPLSIATVSRPWPLRFRSAGTLAPRASPERALVIRRWC